MLESDYLKHLPVFEELAPADLAAISQVTLERRYKKT